MRAPTVIAPSTPPDATRLGRVLWLLAALTALLLPVWRWPFYDAGRSSFRTTLIPMRMAPAGRTASSGSRAA